MLLGSHVPLSISLLPPAPSGPCLLVASVTMSHALSPAAVGAARLLVPHPPPDLVASCNPLCLSGSALSPDPKRCLAVFKAIMKHNRDTKKEQQRQVRGVGAAAGAGIRCTGALCAERYNGLRSMKACHSSCQHVPVTACIFPPTIPPAPAPKSSAHQQ